jgi:hypothetical protein
MPDQVSPGAAVTGPDVAVGQRPWAAWCASAQARICSHVRLGRFR